MTIATEITFAKVDIGGLAVEEDVGEWVICASVKGGHDIGQGIAMKVFGTSGARILCGAKERGLLLSGTALSAFVVAGLFSPMSVQQAAAACTLGGNVVTCDGTSPGYTETVSKNRSVIVNKNAVVEDSIILDTSGKAGADIDFLVRGGASLTGVDGSAIQVTLGSNGKFTYNVEDPQFNNLPTITSNSGLDTIRVTGGKSAEMIIRGNLSNTSNSNSGGEVLNIGVGTPVGSGGININFAEGTASSARSDGFVLNTTGTAKVTIGTKASLTGGNDQGDDGILIVNAADVDLVVEGKGSIDVAGNGISVLTASNNASVSNAGSVSGGANGIFINNVTGDVTVTNTGHVGGNDGAGLSVQGSGDVTVTNSSLTSMLGIGNGAEFFGDNTVKYNNAGGLTSGLNGDGIHIEDVAGSGVGEGKNSVKINNTDGIVSGGDDGIYIDDVENGDVAVDNSAGLIAGIAGDGVQISDVENGSVRINNSGTQSASKYLTKDIDPAVASTHFAGQNKLSRGIVGDDDGIDLEDISDYVVINNADGRIVGENGHGINLDDIRGDVLVDSDGKSNGDLAYAVVVLNAEGRVVGKDGDGIQIDTVRNGGIYVANGDGTIIGSDDGINIDDVWDGDVFVANSGGSVKASEDGIQLTEIDGNVRIDNTSGLVSADDENGVEIDDVEEFVYLDNTGGRIVGGDDGIDIDGVDGDDLVGVEGKSGKNAQYAIAIRNDSTYDVDGILVDQARVRGSTTGIRISDVDVGGVYISNKGGEIVGQSDDGINIDGVDDGDVRIANGNGVIRGDDDGIHIEDVNGNVEINSGKEGKILGGSDSAIDARDIDGTVTIENAGLIRGEGENFVGQSIRIEASDDVTILNKANGVITTNSGDWDARAITSLTGGANEITNNGTITGAVTLIAAEGNTFTNNSGNTWKFSGLNTFATFGDNLFDNTADGVARADDAIVLFISGGDSVINNDGVVVNTGDNFYGFASGGESRVDNAGVWRVDGSTILGGLGDLDFNNDGVVNMSRDDAADDYMEITSLLGSADYNAGLDAVLAIDAELTPGGDADFLFIDGNISGETYLRVDDLEFFLPGEYDPNGIQFAQVGEYSDVGDFYTDGGIDKGLFRYDAYLLPDYNSDSGDNEWYLASVLDREAYEFPVITAGANALWNQSTGTWLDRTADLRSGFGETGSGIVDLKSEGAVAATPGNVTPGIWGRVFGGTQERDMSNVSAPPPGMLGPSYTFDDTYNQDFYGFTAGIDFGKESITEKGANEAWIFGILAGYAGSQLDFDNSNTEVDYTAGSVGAYVTYLNGGLFVDATIKADFGKIDYNSNAGGGFSEEFDSDYTSIGGVIDTGYRFNMASGMYFEPKATLSYVNTSIDDVVVLGTGVSFDDGESIRGRLGGRVGATFNRGSNVIEPYLEASVWNEFSGDYTATLFSNGFNAPVNHDEGGTYGEVTAGASVINVGNGWSGFAKGAVQFGDENFLGVSGNLGLRKAF